MATTPLSSMLSCEKSSFVSHDPHLTLLAQNVGIDDLPFETIKLLVQEYKVAQQNLSGSNRNTTALPTTNPLQAAMAQPQQAGRQPGRYVAKPLVENDPKMARLSARAPDFSNTLSSQEPKNKAQGKYQVGPSPILGKPEEEKKQPKAGR